MGRKKIQKAPKGSKAEEDDHSDHEPAQDSPNEPAANSPANEAENSPLYQATSKKGAKKGGKSKQVQKKESGNKNVELFPEQFRKKLDDFKNFYTEYLQMKANNSDVDQGTEFKNVSDSIRNKIDEACSKVLKQGIVDAQKWIQDKKNITKDQIKSVERAQNDTRAALQISGTFSASEIDSQLTAIRNKKSLLQQHLQGLDTFKSRAADLYKTQNGIMSSHQYSRAFGCLPLVQGIAKFYKRWQKLDAENQICTVQGGVQGLFDCVMAFVEQGDQVVFFDPSYDCYRAQVQMAGGRSVGIPLKPKHQQSKQMLKQRCKNQYKAQQIDEWEIDFPAFEKAINEKTRMLILNSPHNPVGKVFTQLQIQKIAAILQKFPRIVVVEDNVYQGMTFDDMFQKQLPKLSFLPGFHSRTLSVYSGGKIFAATGSRLGWVIGQSSLIKCVRAVHQYNVFCAYSVVQTAGGRSLQTIADPNNTYMKQYAQKLTKNRNLLLDELIASKFDFNLWIPKGGYFVVADISRIQVDEKYLVDEQGNKRTKDYAFCFQLAHQQGVVAIPCSAFYSKEDSHLGEKYVRFAFCKDQSMIKDAGKRIK